MSDDDVRPDDRLSIASRAAPIAREQAHSDKPRRSAFIQSTTLGQRFVVAEAENADAAQIDGSWVAARDPVEVRR
jgi:hypothetical protein